MKYVDVIIDNNTDATDELYTYRCEFDGVKAGDRVSLPFGVHNRQSEAYVVKVSDTAPEGVRRFKNVTEILEPGCLTAEAVDTAVWMRGRCLCRYIEAIKCFLPGYTQSKRKIKDPFEGIEADPDTAKELNDEQAAALAAKYSSAAAQDKVEVDYVKKKELKKPAGAAPGFVVYYTNYSMVVRPGIVDLTEVI